MRTCNCGKTTERMKATELNYIHQEDELQEGTVPIESLILLRGIINDRYVQILKDDGCNTNVISHEFYKKNKELFKVVKRNIEVRHSEDKTVEQASEVILEGTIRIGTHVYTSNWVIARCRYDVILGMLWHVANNPEIDYSRMVVKVNSEDLPLACSGNRKIRKVQVMNLGVKSSEIC